MRFELSDKEIESYLKFLKKIKKKYGSYGFITYSFTPTGIGSVVKIKSDHNEKKWI